MTKPIPRRTFLRGAGAAVALPWLEAMTPRARGGERAEPPCRVVFVYVPNGIEMQYWTPAMEGTSWEWTRTLEPLQPHRQDLLLLSGLAHHNGKALGDGPGDHARAAASYLTGAHPVKTAGADIFAGVSIDQAIAAAIGNKTRFASLELGCEDGRQAGSCDSGYSCAYSNNLAWRTPTSPLPPEVNPRLVFERFFGSEEGLSTARYRRSVLDLVMDDARALQKSLGSTDRRKLEEYLEALRGIEKRIPAAGGEGLEAPRIEKPMGIPLDFGEHVRLMFDLLVLALEADLSRVSTLMLAREGSNRTYREIEVPEAHHALTHHRKNPEMIEKVAAINRHHVELFSHLLDRLSAIDEGDGSLLDHSIVVYGSGLSDGNRHWHHDLPVLLAGKGCGRVRPGRHVVYPRDTPMCDLFLALLHRLDAPADSFGDSRGPLDHLS